MSKRSKNLCLFQFIKDDDIKKIFPFLFFLFPVSSWWLYWRTIESIHLIMSNKVHWVSVSFTSIMIIIMMILKEKERDRDRENEEKEKRIHWIIFTLDSSLNNNKTLSSSASSLFFHYFYHYSEVSLFFHGGKVFRCIQNEPKHVTLRLKKR